MAGVRRMEGKVYVAVRMLVIRTPRHTPRWAGALSNCVRWFLTMCFISLYMSGSGTCGLGNWCCWIDDIEFR